MNNEQLKAYIGVSHYVQQQADWADEDVNSVSYIKNKPYNLATNTDVEEVRSDMEQAIVNINNKFATASSVDSLTTKVNTLSRDVSDVKQKMEEFESETFYRFRDDIADIIDNVSFTKEVGSNTINVTQCFEQKYLGQKNTDSDYLKIVIPDNLKNAPFIKLHYYFDIIRAGYDWIGIDFEGITIGKEYYTTEYIDEPQGHQVVHGKEFEFTDLSINNYTAEADILLTYGNGAFDARVRLIIRPMTNNVVYPTQTESEE